MTPQDRPNDWSLDRRHAVAEQGRQVRVQGGLFYDIEHSVTWRFECGIQMWWSSGSELGERRFTIPMRRVFGKLVAHL